MGTTPSIDITGLQAGKTYYFAVTARDTSGNQSGFSQQVSVTIPAATLTKSNTNGTGSESLLGGVVDQVGKLIKDILGLGPDDPLYSLSSSSSSQSGSAQVSLKHHCRGYEEVLPG